MDFWETFSGYEEQIRSFSKGKWLRVFNTVASAVYLELYYTQRELLDYTSEKGKNRFQELLCFIDGIPNKRIFSLQRDT